MSQPRPSSVTIAGHAYEIQWLTQPRPGDDGDRMGFTDSNRLAIGVVEGLQAPSQMRDTLLHEVLHAIVAQGWLAVPPSPFQRGQEERVIGVFATHLLDTMRRNPGVAAWLFEEIVTE